MNVQTGPPRLDLPQIIEGTAAVSGVDSAIAALPSPSFGSGARRADVVDANHVRWRRRNPDIARDQEGHSLYEQGNDQNLRTDARAIRTAISSSAAFDM